jgi:hypothetical protein
MEVREARPEPYEGMLVYDGVYESWSHLGPREVLHNGRQEHRQLEISIHRDYVAWRDDGKDKMWLAKIYLPGEDGCPDIPKDFQHDWKPGDRFWYLFESGWDKGILSKDADRDHVLWRSRSIFIPPEVEQEIRIGNLLRAGGTW